MTIMLSLMGVFKQVPCMYGTLGWHRVYSIDIKTDLKDTGKNHQDHATLNLFKKSDLHCMLTENKVWNKRATLTDVVIFSFRRAVQRSSHNLLTWSLPSATALMPGTEVTNFCWHMMIAMMMRTWDLYSSFRMARSWYFTSEMSPEAKITSTGSYRVFLLTGPAQKVLSVRW